MFSRLRRTMTYANVVATLALFLSLGGAAYAGAKIGSADIKNHSIAQADLASASVGSPQVIDNSLRLNDLAASVKSAFVKTVYQFHDNYDVGSQVAPTIPMSPGSSRIASLTLPNGRYLLTATVHVQGPLTSNPNAGSPEVEIECTLGDPSASAAQQVKALEDFRGEYHDDHVLPLLVSATVTSGKVVIDCDHSNAPVVDEPVVREVSIEAVKVDQIS